MSDLTDKFASLQTQMGSEAEEAHSQRATIELTLEDIQTALANINSDMLLMRNLLAAGQSQSDPCMACPPPSLITPPTSTTGTAINPDKCKRSQALVNAIHEIAGVIGAATNSGIFWTPSIIVSGITEVVTTLITGGMVPLPSFGEATNIAAKAISYAVNNIVRGDDLQAQFDTLAPAIISALAFTTSAGAAQSAYNSIIEGSSLPSDEKLLLEALGFNDLFSYFFDTDSTPDLSPYDGTACGGSLHDITGCTDFDASAATADGASWYAIVLPVAFPGSGNDFMITGDYYHWTVKLLSTNPGSVVQVRYVGSDDGNHFGFSLGAVNDINSLNTHTQAIAIYTSGHDSDAHPFSVEICPPE